MLCSKMVMVGLLQSSSSCISSIFTAVVGLRFIISRSAVVPTVKVVGLLYSISRSVVLTVTVLGLLYSISRSVVFLTVIVVGLLYSISRGVGVLTVTVVALRYAAYAWL